MHENGIWMMALSAACLLASSCADAHDDGDSERLDDVFAAARRIDEQLCVCEPDASCGIDSAETMCGQNIAREHAKELDAWSVCALEVLGELEACVERAGCELDPISDCRDEHDVEAACPFPDGPERTIQNEVAMRASRRSRAWTARRRGHPATHPRVPRRLDEEPSLCE